MTPSLRRKSICAMYIATALLGPIMMDIAREHPWRWWLGAGPAAGALCQQVLRRGPGPRGWAMRVTYLRGVLLIILAGMTLLGLAQGQLWVVGCVYALFVAGDILDGYLARHLGQTSKFGSHFDEFLDSVAAAIVPLQLIWVGRLPVAYLCIALASPIVHLALHLRARMGLECRLDRAVPSPRFRLLAGYHMAISICACIPLIADWAVRTVALVWTIPSVAGFVWWWRQICGAPTTRTPYAWLPDGVRPLARLRWFTLALAAGAMVIHPGLGQSLVLVVSMILVVSPWTRIVSGSILALAASLCDGSLLEQSLVFVVAIIAIQGNGRAQSAEERLFHAKLGGS